MLFTPGGGSYGLPSMHDYYLEQSSGRFTWTGQVSYWVQVNATEAEFGGNLPKTGAGGDDANGSVYRVVDFALKALGRVRQLRWPRSGEGGSDRSLRLRWRRHLRRARWVYRSLRPRACRCRARKPAAGAQGGNAIWSHSWYANFDDESGPAGCLLGGYNLPGTNLWVGDYTIQPEDGGVGVFAHEFGHDLGLPDLYDTAGGPDNGTGFWTLMSSGSWASDSPDAIGDHPVHMGGMGETGARLAWRQPRTRCARRRRDSGARPRGRRDTWTLSGASCRSAQHLENAHPVSRGRQRPELLLLGAGRQSRQPDDEILRRRRGDADVVPRDVGHRDRLGLCVSRGSGERRVADGPDERVPDHQPERPELRVWHHRLDAELDHGDGHAARRDHVVRVPLLDRRVRGAAGICGRLHLDRRSRRQRDDDDRLDVWRDSNS